MPKLKTHKGAAKRFKKTATGKVEGPAIQSHLGTLVARDIQISRHLVTMGAAHERRAAVRAATGAARGAVTRARGQRSRMVEATSLAFALAARTPRAPVPARCASRRG